MNSEEQQLINQYLVFCLPEEEGAEEGGEEEVRETKRTKKANFFLLPLPSYFRIFNGNYDDNN